MAQKNTKPLLGFEDELIQEKHKGSVNFTTNKLGGKADIPNNIKFEKAPCPLCQLPRPLVVQIYVPLEGSPYHRTLYLFACINANCWNNSDSWTCVRIQTKEKIQVEEEIIVTPKTNATEWCVDADQWDDDNNANLNEKNGNLISNMERNSDEDDESCSLEDSLRVGFGNLAVDDKNANIEAQGGAVGRLHSPAATAEIEGDEGEVISIDTPTIPQRDITALLHEVTPLPQDICQNIQSGLKRIPSVQFVPSFISVWEESATPTSTIGDSHVKELLQEYQKNESIMDVSEGDNASSCDPSFEKYEKSNPVHGDKMFHNFLTKIQQNPGQILRYSRDIEPPLLLYPLQEPLAKCSYCQSEVMFEFQLLPTLISKLRLTTDVRQCSRLEYGTVLVFTCSKSCWSTDANFRYETVIVQSEMY